MKSVGHKELITMLARFQSAKEYVALKKSCVSAVTEWRWATGPMLPELPHDHLVRGIKPPKWSKKQTRNGFLHGLDKDGRVQCIRSDDRTKPDENVYEQFLIHEDNGFWCIYFNNERKKSVLGVKWFEMKDGRWLHSWQIGHYGIRGYVLNWEGDRLVKYFDRSWPQVAVSDPQAAAAAKLGKGEVMEYTYSYAADGELERVTEEQDLGKDLPRWFEVKYQRVPKGANLKTLLQEVEDMLAAEIPKTIQAVKAPETVYGLLLQFTGVDTDLSGFAPPMFLPPEGLRRRALEERPKDAAWYLWAVQEWEGDPGVVRLSCKNAAIDEKLHLIFQLTVVQASPTNYGPVRKMFQRLCARLNAFDWRRILKTTDDFIVIPFDPHAEMELKEDLKACVPPEKLRLLMDRGHIGRIKVK